MRTRASCGGDVDGIAEGVVWLSWWWTWGAGSGIGAANGKLAPPPLSHGLDAGRPVVVMVGRNCSRMLDYQVGYYMVPYMALQTFGFV